MREDGRLVGGKGWKERVYNRGMEEASENGKESLHSTHANGMNERTYTDVPTYISMTWTFLCFCFCLMICCIIFSGRHLHPPLLQHCH